MLVFEWLETNRGQTGLGAHAASRQLHCCMGCAGGELLDCLLHAAANTSWLSSAALTRRHVCDCPTRLCLLRLYECPGEAKICNLQVVEMQGLAKWTSAARTHTQQCMQQPAAWFSVQIALTLTVKPRASFVELHNKILLPA